MTNAAETEIETLQDGVYIPNGIVACADGGHLIHEGEDNIDINTKTIDGKNTFHVLQQSSNNTYCSKAQAVKIAGTLSAD